MKKILETASLILIGAVLGYTCQEGDNSKEQSSIHEELLREKALTEWQLLQLAIAKTESEYDTGAVGKTEDWGLFQLTPIYVEDVNRILGTDKYQHEDAFNPDCSADMFRVFQCHYNPELNREKAIRLHNPGGYSSGYATKVEKNLEYVRRYEAARAVIINY